MNSNSTYTFDHWDSGSTNKVRNVTPLNSTTLNAYYNTHATNGTQSTWSVTINSRNLLGWVTPHAPDGLFVRVYFASNGTLKTSGYTPFTYTASNNVKYKIDSTLSYLQWKFDHWDTKFTNNTSNIRYVTPVSNMNIFEYYTQPVNLTVQSEKSAGSPVSGATVKIYNSTGVETTGTTPFTYAVAQNKTYTVNLSNFGGESFVHWDNGLVTTNRTLGIVSQAIITGNYTP